MQEWISFGDITNPMHPPLSSIKQASVYHNGHEECMRHYGNNHKCKKSHISFDSNIITEVKENDFCQKHGVKFINEHFKLPSGKTEWKGCPHCYQKKIDLRNMRLMESYMKESGMRYKNETNEWYKPEIYINPVAPNEE
ncbi:MAG TPA: hypothetical protein VHM20_05575, partial [Gammaproteobacteria bacterium]|nr:hypothetical protein [Gammaproteobacteria bacterium]